jgi:hypothetical protein
VILLPQTLRRFTQDSITRLDRAGLFGDPHMALQNKQSDWYGISV